MAAWSRNGDVLRYCAGVGFRSRVTCMRVPRLPTYETSIRVFADQLTLHGELPPLHVGGSSVRVEERDALAEVRGQPAGRARRRQESAGEGIRQARGIGQAVVERRHQIGGLAEAGLVDVHVDHAERVEEDAVAAAEHRLAA